VPRTPFPPSRGIGAPHQHLLFRPWRVVPALARFIGNRAAHVAPLPRATSHVIRENPRLVGARRWYTPGMSGTAWRAGPSPPRHSQLWPTLWDIVSDDTDTAGPVSGQSGT